MSRFVRNSVFGTLAGLSTTLGNFLSSLVVARMLGVDQAGAVAFAVWVIWFGTTIIEAGIPFTLARYMPEVIAREGEAEAKALAAFLFRPYALFVAIPAAGFGLYAAWLCVRPGDGPASLQPLGDPVICLLIGLNCTTLALGDYARSLLRGLHDFGRVAKLTSAAAALQITGLCLGSFAFGPRGAVAAYLVASLLPLAVLTSLRGQRGPLPQGIAGRMLRYTRFRWASDLLGFFVWSRVEILFCRWPGASRRLGSSRSG